MNKAPEAFRTISEVADELDLPQHVLRFWESRFPQVRPMKRGGGRRYYRPDDVDLLRGIRHLLYGEGYTIRGVQRILREQGGRFVQTVWQEGAPQPERKPELDGTESEAEIEPDAADVADTAAAFDEVVAGEMPPQASPIAKAAEGEHGEAERDESVDPSVDPYGRREPSFGAAGAPPHATPALGSHPPPKREAAPLGATPHDITGPREAAPASEPAVRAAVAERTPPIAREVPAVSERAAAVPVAPRGLSAADRARLATVLDSLEACRALLRSARESERTS